MGDNIYLGDRNGVRTPMQWSGDRNAGFSRGEPAAAVPAGDHRPRVPLRGGQRRGAAGQPALAAVVDEAADRPAQAATRRSGGRSLEFLHPENRQVLAFLRTLRGRARPGRREPLALRRSTSSSTCRAFEGMVPVELFGQTPVPGRSATRPYLLTLGPHAFYWFALQRPPAEVAGSATSPMRRRCSVWPANGSECSHHGDAPNSRQCCSRSFAAAGGSRARHRATRSLRVAEIVRLAVRRSVVCRARRRGDRLPRGRAGAVRPPAGVARGRECGRDARSAAARGRRIRDPRGRARGRRRRARGAGVLRPPARGRRAPTSPPRRTGAAREPSLPRAPRVVGRDGRPARAGAPRRRADELLGRLRQPTDPEVLPPATGGSEPRARDRSRPGAGAASRTPPPCSVRST